MIPNQVNPENDLEILLTEYRELCQDWRQRDKYLLDKLGVAGILFALIGIAVGAIPPAHSVIRIGLLLVGAFFSLLLCLSVTKDILYQDGTQKVLSRLALKLGIPQLTLGLFNQTEIATIFSSDENLEFLRKIKIRAGQSTVSFLPKWARNWAQAQRTLIWILFFYILSFLVFIAAAIILLVG
ncbi:MAG: hypothetical protein PHE50_06650 [Dehalococcoidales bacterium]|nr:hypothetical protein [Dehalococcoidales bacterium]